MAPLVFFPRGTLISGFGIWKSHFNLIAIRLIVYIVQVIAIGLLVLVCFGEDSLGA